MGKVKMACESDVSFGNYSAPHMDRPAKFEERITHFRENAFERVRIGLADYNGCNLVDVRVFVDPGGTHDIQRMQPTKKGVSVQVQDLRRLIEGLQAAERRTVLLGLLEPATEG